jgi:hypothetical protein
MPASTASYITASYFAKWWLDISKWWLDIWLLHQQIAQPIHSSLSSPQP